MPPDPRIVHADRALLVLDKPGGLLAVPGRGPAKQDCLVSRAKRLFADLPPQPAVHRLDLATSGLMLLARTPAAHRSLAGQFQHRQVDKRYIALVQGAPAAAAGTIELCFRLDPENRPRQVLDPLHGKRGVTLWRAIASEPRGTRVEFTPLTGRTHQLRLHAAHPLGLGCPIVGDFLYGTGRDGDAMLLHASYLRFVHPSTGGICEFHSTPPF